MPNETKQDRERWFQWCIDQLANESTFKPPRDGRRYRCPCCRCRTLEERGAYEICPVCFWEDDGQVDHDADAIRGGPNHSLSLTQARENYIAFGACDKRSVENVRVPTIEECK